MFYCIKIKPMKKPLSIIILSVLFLISPFLILLFNAALNMIPILGYGSIFYRLTLQDIIILLLYPLSAISIWLVRKWGWWVLICSAVIMICYNSISLIYNPFASALTVLLMNSALFGVAILFFRRHLIAPYFHPRLRWWEQDRRYEIDIYLEFTGIKRNVVISDISMGGCYIYVDFLLETGVDLPVQIVYGNFHISLFARIMRIAEKEDGYFGYGLMFQKIDSIQKKGLNQLIDRLKSFVPADHEKESFDERRSSHRYFLNYDFSLQCADINLPVNLSDISKSGCSLIINREISDVLPCQLHYMIDQFSHKISVETVWKHHMVDRVVYGMKFTNLTREDKKSLNRLIEVLRQMGAKKRETPIDDYRRLCEEEAEDTPYRIISRLRKLI